jgi:hypothetical protein
MSIHGFVSETGHLGGQGSSFLAKKDRCRVEDLIGTAQITVLPLKLPQPLTLI